MCMKETIRHIGRGAAMGCADIIPGISGGSVALILGFYERLIAAISTLGYSTIGRLFTFRWVSLWKQSDGGFLAPLLAGILGGILFCTHIVGLPHLLEVYPEPVYGLFFGLILGSIFMLLGHYKPLALDDYSALVPGALLVWLFLQVTPVDMPHDPIPMFFYGIIASSAMLLPGISGSFLLLLFGQYETIIRAIADGDASILFPLLLGIFCGLAVMARFIRALLYFHERTTLVLMVGVLIGSLWRIWPFQTVNGEGISAPYIPMGTADFVSESFAFILLGMVIVYGIDKTSQRAN